MSASAVPTEIPSRYLVELLSVPSAQLSCLSGAPIEILDDGAGIANALAKALRARGYEVSVVESASPDIRQLIDLRALRGASTIDEAIAMQRAAFETAHQIAGCAESFVVAFDLGGNFGFGDEDDVAVQDGTRAWMGGLAALAKTANLEWEHAAVKAIDVATEGLDPSVVATRIESELIGGGPEVEVAFDGRGRRRTVRTRKVDQLAENKSSAMGPDDVVVASGGARGVTARCLIELARTCAPAIVLLGRTALDNEPDCAATAADEPELKRVLIEAAKERGESPSLPEIGRQAAAILKQREIRATIAAIEDAGAEVQYLAADVRDRQALQAGLDAIRKRFGAPTALVHAAGVLADKTIADKTGEQFDFVFDTKVDGLRALLEVMDDDPLETVCVFSSVAARTGNVGQVDYAMANETLNKVARAVSVRRDISASAINWGPWDGGMVDASLRAHFEARGVRLIDLDGGAQAFCREFGGPKSKDVEVLRGDGLPEAAASLRAPLSFDATVHPAWSGHRIDGTVVVPAASVIDMLSGLAQSVEGGRSWRHLRDIEVVRGIRLPDFDETASSRFIATVDGDGPRAQVALQGTDGTVHYRAGVDTDSARPAIEPIEILDAIGDHSEGDDGRLYGEFLFHSGPYEVLRSVQGIGQSIARAEIADTTRAIAIDAGLQLALVQALKAGKKRNLPTAVESFVDVGLPRHVEGLNVVVRTRDTSSLRAVFDVDYRDESGDVLASLRGLIMHYIGESIDLNDESS